jgi:hypothetical protein
MRIKRELKNNITYLSLVEEVYNPEKKRVIQPVKINLTDY